MKTYFRCDKYYEKADLSVSGLVGFLFTDEKSFTRWNADIQ